MDDRNQLLKNTFLFDSSDLLANRRGQLSARQQARQRAAGANLRLAITIFIVVMIGTLVIIAFSSLKSGLAVNLSEMAPTLITVAAVVAVVILVGVLTSLKYATAARVRQISVASGAARAGRVRADQASYQVKIGTIGLRLLTEEQMTAFQPGVEYRVYYLAGPVPTILSGEALGSEAEAEALAPAEASLPPEQDVTVQLQRRARLILVVLAVLVLGIPLLAIATSGLPEGLRWGLWIVMLVIAVVFFFWALRRLSR